ncbi:MAG: hypothetical protein ACXW05_20840 [Gemmatirosa sp.]
MRPFARALLVGLVALVQACTFGEQAIAPDTERTVVHAVLNPAAADQYVLVERTLTGRIAAGGDTLGSGADPIVSGGGVPVHGARVEVRDASGASVIATETQIVPPGTTRARGTGVYRFANLVFPPNGSFGQPRAGLRIVPGAELTLRVDGVDGGAVTGSTRVPGVATTAIAPRAQTALLVRDVDTLRLRWDPAPGARSYLVRIESPYGAFFLFTDSAAVQLTGDLRNLFAERLPRVFQAGFTQWVSVAAIDTNFFDYYRSGNSPFTGSGLINRLNGGIGVFGAYVPMLSVAVTVRATPRDPFDARYFANGPQGREQLRLWVDARSGALAEITGAYRLPTEEQYGILGTLDGTRLRLRAVESGDARVANRVIEGEVRGDTLLVQMRGALLVGDDGRRAFVREREP